MPRFSIKTSGGEYYAVVERGAIGQWSTYAQAGKRFIVTERLIWNLQGSRLNAAADNVIYLPGGEENKRLSVLEEAAGELVSQRADRSSMIVAFGGGIVTDMAGFLAAIFLRGIPVLQIPTTLLAQVDAAIGGKTGVNLVSGKNLLGSFHQPRAVLIDPDVLGTLPEREFRAGLFEVIKHAVIAGPELFQYLTDHRERILQRDPVTLEHIIAESVRIKAEVVSADERESGLRRILNLGHTVGHALEAETNYVRFLHGEAVAIGMYAATAIAESLNMLNSADRNSIDQLIRTYGDLPAADNLDLRSILRRLVGDKKTRDGRVHFILPTRIGAVEVVSGIEESIIENAIRQALL